MLRKLIRKIWQATPAPVRVNLIWYLQKKFTVSAAAVVFNDENKVLLLNHILRPLSPWGFPGGFIDGGEQPRDAVRRELREETGLELEELKLYRVRTVGRHVEVLFTAAASGTAEVKSREILELGWFAAEEMPAGTSKVQKLLVEELLAATVDKTVPPN